MVKVAVAGGTGNVATELLRVPIASGKHTFTILTRGSPPLSSVANVTYQKVDYLNLESLTEALRGFDACLSFIIPLYDKDGQVQKNLIHACIAAQVRRFAPSEWAFKNYSGNPFYKPKDDIADYLKDLNKNTAVGSQPVLEYCLFQPSIFVDYLAHPYSLSPGLYTWPFFVDFESRRAIVTGTGDQPIVLTAVSDVSAMLDMALSDPNPWPAVGGMHGSVTSINELIALGKKLRGGNWSIEYLESEDIENGELKASWAPAVTHPGVKDGDREEFGKLFLVLFLQAIQRGAWMVSDEWNRRFPHYSFMTAEGYLVKAWEGKP